MLYVHLKRICSPLFLDKMFCIYLISPYGSMCHLMSDSMLISCLNDLSSDLSMVLKSATVVLLSISPLLSVNINCAPMLGA